MKFKLRKDISKEVDGTIVYRIEYLKDIFPCIKKGDVTGWLEKEKNLDQTDASIVWQEACVFDDAFVFKNACVSQTAEVFGKAIVDDNAHVYGQARVFGKAYVSGSAHIFGSARVSGLAFVSGDARIYDQARVSGNARVYNNLVICKDAYISSSTDLADRNELMHFHIPFKNSITITKNHIQIGCEVHEINHWLKEINKIGIQHNYTVEEIEAVTLIIKGALKLREKK